MTLLGLVVLDTCYVYVIIHVYSWILLLAIVHWFFLPEARATCDCLRGAIVMLGCVV